MGGPRESVLCMYMKVQHAQGQTHIRDKYRLQKEMDMTPILTPYLMTLVLQVSYRVYLHA